VGSIMSSNANHKFPTRLSGLAKALRKQATPGEKKLWALFQKLRLSTGIRFRRQQPIGNYIADFYCASYKCVVEIDGISHETKVSQDLVRNDYMKSLGITVFRFTEQETQQNCEAVLETILAHFKSLSPTPPLTPPSRGGE